jgi:hypothetical protein
VFLCIDECQLVARLPLAICNLWKSSHLHHMHTINMRHHHTIFNYKISNLFYSGKQNFPNMSFLLIMFGSCSSRYQSSLWAYIPSISKTILPAIFSIFKQPNKLLAYHNNFQLLISQICLYKKINIPTHEIFAHYVWLLQL